MGGVQADQSFFTRPLGTVIDFTVFKAEIMIECVLLFKAALAAVWRMFPEIPEGPPCDPG